MFVRAGVVQSCPLDMSGHVPDMIPDIETGGLGRKTEAGRPDILAGHDVNLFHGSTLDAESGRLRYPLCPDMYVCARCGLIDSWAGRSIGPVMMARVRCAVRAAGPNDESSRSMTVTYSFTRWMFALALVWTLILGLQAEAAPTAATAPTTKTIKAAVKPNVVLIYGDDVGYADLGVYGSKLIRTPHLDRLAKEGLRFTDGHCSAATCTPSRFSLLTGIHGFRHGVRILPPNARLLVPTDKLTLPKVFKKAGYKTGIVGKWHLGLGEKGKDVNWNGEVKPGPIEVGFDYSFLLPSTNDRVPCVYLENYRVVNHDPNDPIHVGSRIGPDKRSTVYPDGKTNRAAMTYYESSHGHNNSVINGVGRIGYMAGGKKALWDDETMADVFVEQSKKFIAKHKDEPFFLFFSSQDIHVPRMPHPRFKGKSKLSYRGDAMVQLDWCAGEIMKTLDKHGLTENTIVIFSSDNGPVYDDGYKDGTTIKPRSGEVDRGHDGSGPYSGGKYQILEGGTRVPFIVRWPARIKPGVSDALVSQIDFVASFAAMHGIDIPKDDAIDSQNVLKALLGDDKVGNTYIIEEAGGLAVRKGDWKFVAGGGKRNNKGKQGKQNKQAKPAPGKLYNLKSDIGEKVDVASKHPDVAKALSEFIKRTRMTGLRHQDF